MPERLTRALARHAVAGRVYVEGRLNRAPIRATLVPVAKGRHRRRRIEDARLRRVETLAPNAHVHVLRVTEAPQLDRRLAGWLREAYAVGRQESA